MAVAIDEAAGRMVSDECGTVAVRQPGGSWAVTGRAGRYDRNQAITALTVAELLATGDEPDSPLVRALEDELTMPAHGYDPEEG